MAKILEIKRINSSIAINLVLLLICTNFLQIVVKSASISSDSDTLALVEGDKIAVVVLPKDFGKLQALELSKQSIARLEEFDYLIVRIEKRAEICHIRARQVVVLYIGHGEQEHSSMLFVRSGEQIPLSELLVHIETERLILLVNACYGGSWLEFQAENRLIISVVNDTICCLFLIPKKTPSGPQWLIKGSLFDLFGWCKYYPIERSYESWRLGVIRYYSVQGFSGIHPVIYDGINEEVWL